MCQAGIELEKKNGGSWAMVCVHESDTGPFDRNCVSNVNSSHFFNVNIQNIANKVRSGAGAVN